ncbi:MAG: preprotein translocase subunit SecA [Subdoligranulum variabile]|uniref:preprotein translocase subunit SecA n=1 Tax=Gemmiger sp. TaxID=2049027 RepID=UPI002A91FE7F|nr:preprotein translocase subunit SecA [Gemmiger sp.]MDD7639186.1 preprotein translocase subunit SecA [Subdoligranulum variabile]MDY5605801.1 preprotein translocase subunit SecA [Gemmiger sp.]
MSFFEKLFGSFSDKELKRINPLKDKVLALEPEMQKLTDEELQAKTAEFKARLEKGETLDDLLPEAFAVCREADWRVLGMKPYPVQIIGGIVLHRACIAEMQTGEGKTLVATMPVYLNALTGRGVHVVTVNDYLARRDSEWMGKVYRFLGLTVGLVVHGVEANDRKAAYEADVTYGTNNEFGFDYLRDNMVVYKANMVQRGHAYAIVDEVDSILIDEARTPLIISGKGEDSSVMYKRADDFAKTLKKSVIVELDDKVATEEQVDGDYVVDEKRKTATLTESGVQKAEAFFHVENLADADNMSLRHYIDGAIKARGVMHRDIDYIVKEGEVIIVDEFTGRLMYGRRFNDGLHQAIEAKEGVTVAAESKTLATVTFQNYFRMYDKLAGMTGTASTEADEFSEIYGLNIVSIPTNKPRARKDLPDSVYKTVNGKYNAVIEQVAECHAKGQPVLVGTVSVEKSEALSKLLKKKGIEHNVLNAKQHEREAEIVAQAGKQGAVTIATNMAGRGTDIMLGGNVPYMAKAALRKELSRELTKDLAQLKDEYEHAKARAKAAGTELPTPPEETIDARLEHLMTECDGHADTDDTAVLNARKRFEELCEEFAPEVKREAAAVREAGGLFIIGTERHESRRIDNQLRGRAGRQGDPGASRFFLSLEDDLMRIFGGERVQSLMDSLGLEEDVPIENKLITNTIESAQKKLEASNFAIRKQVLQYDDVMNQQREIIYKQRQMVLDGEDISDKLHEMMRQSIDDACTNYLNGETSDDWDFAGLRRHFMNWLCLPSDFNYTKDQLEDLTKEGIADELYKRGMDILTAKEKKYGAKTMRELERICLLRNVDSKWMDHIDNMDQLKQGMGLRGYGQHDPVVEYRIEGFAMFDEMIASIREDAVHMLLTIEIRQQNAEPKREQVAKPTGEGAPTQAGTKGAAPVRVTKIGRNDPCPCGSGLKWKKCTCKEYHPDL